MKKLAALLLIILSLALIFSSCSKSEAAKTVQEKIKNIGDVDLSKGELIEEVYKEYSLLSGEDKGDVKNFDKLSEIKNQYDALKLYDDKINEITALYDKTFSEYGVSYADIEKAESEINELAPDEKNKLKAEYDKITAKLTEKQEKYNEIKAAAVKSAASYINGLKKAQNLTSVEIKEMGCIAQISDGTTYYLFALNYNNGSENKTVYSSARFAGTPTVDSMMEYKDNFYSEKPMSDKTNPLKSGNIILDIAEINKALS